MRFVRPCLFICLVAVLALSLGPVVKVQAATRANAGPPTAVQYTLSPIWDASIQRWSTHIEALALSHRMSPDLIAAVIQAESNGDPSGLSRAGAVGLMGVMPREQGFHNRPSTEALKNGGMNLRWGVSILAQIMRQSGGDLSAALAAYSGGWDQVGRTVPQAYAAAVLDDYGRAVAARAGIAPDIAAQWTVALTIDGGNIPPEGLILGAEPVSGLYLYGEHLVYSFVGGAGQQVRVTGFAVPVALVAPVDEAGQVRDDSVDLETAILARLTASHEAKARQGNPRILLACLPSLARLRGRVNSRWFAPTDCPAWHR